MESLYSKVSSGESLEGVSPADVCLSVCVRVRVSVSPSILVFGARTAGPVRTGEESFDAPEKRKTMEAVAE